ncbi:MAG: DUF92 domain-containing protein [Anaerolineaceae bacterium]
MISLQQIGVGIGLAGLVSAFARRLGALNRSGSIAAFLLGTIVFGLGGLPWSIVLLGFFVSSSGLSRLFKKQKISLNEKFSKTSRRDATQVVANGGVAGVFVLLHLIFPDAVWTWLGFAGALASANADTWATELGVLSQKTPRNIVNGKFVPRGTSGGITLAGTLASLAGAGFIALLTALFLPAIFHNHPVSSTVLFLIITFAGLAGSLVDSWLGATWQAIFFCPTCQAETERFPLHSCGTPTSLLRGKLWLNNDWVNFLCTAAGAVFALFTAFLL